MTNQSVVAAVDASARPEESVLGIGYALLISAEQTGGSYELMKFVVPAGAGPPPHTHQGEDESFYVVDGELDVQLGEQTIHARAGTAIHLPRGIPHSFRNPTSRTASFLCWVVPGRLAGFFDGFKRSWAKDDELPPAVNDEDIGKLLVAAAKFGIEIHAGEQPA